MQCTVPLSQRSNSPKFGNILPEKLAVPDSFCRGVATPDSYAYGFHAREITKKNCC